MGPGGSDACNRDGQRRPWRLAARIEGDIDRQLDRQKTMRRLWLTLAAALVVLVAGPLASASAEGPLLTVVSPVQGALLNERSPTYAGTTTDLDPLDLVELNVYAGTGTAGEKVGEASTIPIFFGWDAQIGTLPRDGTYTVVASEEEAGVSGAPAEATFTVDTTAPQLTLKPVASPTSNSTPSFGGSGGESVGEASPDGPVEVAVLYDDGPLAGTAAVEDNAVPVTGGEWSYTPPTLWDGSYTLHVSQHDQALNESQQNATFTVDTSAPHVTLAVLPSIVGTPMPSLEGAAGTAAGDLGSIEVSIYAGTVAAGSPVQSIEAHTSGGGWSATPAKLADGTYTVIAEQLDSAGNTGQSEPSTFTVKTDGPAVSLDPIATYTNSPSPSFGGELGVADHDLPSVTLEIFAGTVASGKAIRTVEAMHGASTWTAPSIADLADGTYTAIAKQSDEARNTGLSVARTFTVDTLAPSLTLAAPSESTGLETVSGVAGTAPGDRRQVTAELFEGPVAEPGDALEAITVNASSAGAWSATFAGLRAGEYTVLARQPDEAGNTGASAPQTFTVVVPPAGPPPSALPSAPPPQAPSPPIASFTWIPVNPAVGQSVSLASNSTGGSSPLSGFGWDVGSGQFAAGEPLLSTSFATPGPHVVRLQVTDANGLSSVAAHTINVVAQALTLMQPFPIVRIAGSETSSGATVKLLTVQAPPATKVVVSCKGAGCKTKAESRIATASSKSRSRAGAIMLAFPRFQRALRAGAVLQIRVSKAGQIGKFTSFTIRRNKPPMRVDACLQPASSNPSPCPSQ